jgi:hypothetical protein
VTLSDILRETLRLIGDIGCSHVTIARESEGEHAYQIRFTPDKAANKRGYIIEGRRWVDQRPTIAEPSPTSTRGTVGPYVGWSRWSGFMGFGVDGVLADDWKFLP